MDIEKYQQLQRKSESLQRDLNREEGAIAQLMKRLKECGYDSVEEAKKAIKKAQKEEQRLAEEIERDLSKLVEEFPDLLSES